MKLLIAVAALALAANAAAKDLETTVAVECAGKPVFMQTNKFADITPAQEAAMNKNAMAALDAASKQQDRGGPCKMIWQWGAAAAIETAGMRWQHVTQSLRLGAKWLSGVVDEREKAGK
jgi:opacity protein-like surface antigen